jgi:hypothetical protein
MKWFFFFSIFFSAELLASVTKICAKDLKKFECTKLVGGDQEYCLGKNLVNLEKPCMEQLKKQIESFKPVAKLCRDQMAMHCKDYKKQDIKKCLSDNSSKFIGECGKTLNAYLKKK